ncbi:prolyl 4-hydroxylase subunit alpha-1-like isoform X2 [Drosophila obscura]|uniref:prolyl 4-hydroxylase subunit alpha-1-like isoform X2 n=1 Tax=Drosophila obscura TaxID=7282 RepID=UPI001BB27D3E|nr:prolyl 4-hydroxylase subunit alpha-1-like isoform X2 [Drosophila obscura]
MHELLKMRRVKCFLCLIFLWFPSVTLENLDKNYAMSIYDLGELLNYNQVLVNHLEDYADKLQQRVDLVDSFVEITKEKMTQAKGIDSDPLSSFPLLRHMQYDWPNILWHLEQRLGEAQATIISLLHSGLPTAKDLDETLNGLYRIQMIYNLNGSAMSRGLLMGVQHNYSLTPFEGYTIAKYLAEGGDYGGAKDWISVALDLYLADGGNWDLYEQQGLSSDSLYELYVEVLDNLSEDKEVPLAMMTEAIKRYPENHKLERALTRLEMSNRIGEEQETQKQEADDLSTYFRCCSRECRRGSRLYCLYNTTARAFLRLAPLKMELLSLEPYVVLYHDVLSDREMFVLKSLAKNDLVRAVTYNETEKKHSEDSHRTTKAGWLNPRHKIIRRMGILTEDMTNLDLEGSEEFQVLNYGIGGHYAPHVDYFEVSDPYLPDRIATLLFYLSDVPLGGATFFPMIDLSVIPKKGTVLMWYNLDHRGQGMETTFHSACPVVVGSRWVMTKWINQPPQLFRRPCLREHTEKKVA